MTLSNSTPKLSAYLPPWSDMTSRIAAHSAPTAIMGSLIGMTLAGLGAAIYPESLPRTNTARPLLRRRSRITVSSAPRPTLTHLMEASTLTERSLDGSKVMENINRNSSKRQSPRSFAKVWPSRTAPGKPKTHSPPSRRLVCWQRWSGLGVYPTQCPAPLRLRWA